MSMDKAMDPLCPHKVATTDKKMKPLNQFSFTKKYPSLSEMSADIM